MISVCILGSGNVAYHMANAFENSNTVTVKQLYSRSKPSAHFTTLNTNIIHDFEALDANCDVYIIAVSDTAVTQLANHSFFADKFVVHTAGAVALTDIKTKRSGVFYPLQTFSKDKNVDFTNVPLCLECTQKEDYKMLDTLARSISKNVYPVNSDQRKILHVAAVFVCNFTNHLYHIGETLCSTHQMNFDILKPLIEETATKVETLSPFAAQTGPAKRFDQQTIDNHLSLLAEKNQIDIYNLLTQSIQATHERKKL